jgi:hypothetical protein
MLLTTLLSSHHVVFGLYLQELYANIRAALPKASKFPVKEDLDL